MGPIEKALKETFFPSLLKGEEINANFWKILFHRVKHVGLGISYPGLSVKSAYNNSKAANGKLVYSLLGGSTLNYVGHRACVRGASAAARRERNQVELAEMAIQKELAGDQERN